MKEQEAWHRSKEQCCAAAAAATEQSVNDEHNDADETKDNGDNQ